jgi:hypothetical protein
MAEILNGPKSNPNTNKDNGGAFDPELILGRADREYYADSNLMRLTDNLKTIARLKSITIKNDKDRETENKTREELESNWEGLVYSSLIQTEDVLDNQLLRLKNPYPYDHRKRAEWFESVDDGVEKARHSILGKDQEAAVWLDRIRSDIHWGKHNLDLLVSMGAAVENFHDGKKMLGWLASSKRSDAVAANYEGVFAKSIPGLTVDSQKAALLQGEAKVGLREKAVKYQDESMYWRMAVAATHQYDPDDAFKGNSLLDTSEIERKFIKRLFGVTIASKPNEEGEIKETETILNWYAMSSKEEYKRKYLSLMQALLIENAYDDLEKAQSLGGTLEGEAIESLIQRVSKKSQDIIASWHSPSRSLDHKLSSVVVKSGIVYDWGHMISADMSWGYDYEYSKDRNGVRTYKERSVASGSTTVATDSCTPRFWLNSDINSQKKGWPHGPLPSVEKIKPPKDSAKDKKYAERVLEMRPDWQPDFYEEIKRDPYLVKSWNELWENPVWKEFNDKDGKVDKSGVTASLWLKKLVWPYVTSIKTEDGNPLILPIFFPPVLDISFFDSFTLDEGEKVQQKIVKGPAGSHRPTVEQTGRTVWDRMKKKEKMSNIEWSKMNDQLFNRWLINLSQKLKYYTTMSEPMTRMNEDMFAGLFGSSGSSEELKKRVDLGERDERVPVAIMNIAFTPFMVALQTTKQFKVSGEYGDIAEARNQWAVTFAQWMNELDGTKNKEYPKFGRILVELSKFYAAIFTRLGVLKARDEANEVGDMYKELRDYLGGHKQGADIGVDLQYLRPEDLRKKQSSK